MVVALIVYFIFAGGNGGTTTDETAGIQIDDKTASGELPTATTTATGINIIPQATATAKAQQTAVKTSSIEGTKQIKATTSVTPTAAENIAALSSNPCKAFGLSDSWSSPFEKTVCGVVQFTDNQILEPIAEISCTLSAESLAQNYDKDIVGKYVGGECYIGYK